MTIEEWRLRALSRLSDRLDEMGSMADLSDGNLSAIICESSRTPPYRLQDLMQQSQTWQFWTGVDGGGHWCCEGHFEPFDYSVYNDMAKRAGGLLRTELTRALGLDGDGVDVRDDDLWTVALHHICWSGRTSVPFPSFCLFYEFDTDGMPQEASTTAWRPAIGEQPVLMLSEIHYNAFAASSICLDLLMHTPPEEWRSFFGRQGPPPVEYTRADELLGGLPTARKPEILVGALFATWTMRKGTPRDEPVQRKAVLEHIASECGVVYGRALSCFKRTWEELVNESQRAAKKDDWPMRTSNEGRGGLVVVSEGTPLESKGREAFYGLVRSIQRLQERP
ncbi:hypothetical protein Poly30_11140 [Planctomycetes bacterium Poly30]|uniref:Uncharacterized protein n=1 Tax=Saltatorellus ferox TaxID=2528018 RepID=A0A518ENF2_9BACT|nr:hypothetical protein Poly30_11140 [Planctomycetes bacterium Poly30]